MWELEESGRTEPLDISDTGLGDRAKGRDAAALSAAASR